MTTHGVVQAYTQFHTEKLEASVMVSSVCKLDLSLPVDGSLDHQLDIKKFKILEIGNRQEDLGSLDDRADVGIEPEEII